MSRRPVPDHGTYARANGSPGYREPCHCDPCTEEKRRCRKRSKVNRQLGRSCFVDAGPAREHLKTLHKTMGWLSLAAATEYDDKSLFLLHSGRRKKITRAVNARIMAVQPPEAADPGLYIDVTKSMRQIRALMAIGHSGRVIAEAAGSTQARVHLISSGKQPTLRHGLADRIDAAYQQLSPTPAPVNHFSNRVRNCAAAKGWRDPLWWEDMGDIGDPDFDPNASEKTSRAELAAIRRAEVEHLASFGLSAEEIDQRVDLALSSIKAILLELRTGQRRDRTKAAA
ncbi:hypothetical protein ACFYRJ_17605 [Streptomyces sp. NPDC005531]|uniref:hypothetical protein n=1 Tax=Streptomyces sp. NPDC005531 TaxID=3364722 RepID=UPI00367DC26B